METFDLGRVLQTAETIKGLRQRSVVDKLRMQYMGEDQARALAAEGRAQQQFTDQQRLDNTRLLVPAAQSVASAQDPMAQVRAVVPQLQQRGIQFDMSYFDHATPDDVRSGARQVVEHYSPFLTQPSSDTPLETIVGPDGQPVLATRQSAVGKTPWQENQQPSSYDEFLLAQKDPEFRKFLESRRGRGISITQPDGSVIEIGGSGGGVGPSDLSGPSKNRLQETIIQATDELDRLNSIGEGFDPAFLQIPGRLKGAGLKVKDLAGGYLGELSPEESDYLAKFSTFRADAAKNLSSILNRLSGAAISPAEAQRLKTGIPNDEDSPTQFMAKYQSAVKDATRAVMRANWALKNGIGVQSAEQLSRTMPLNGIDEVYQERANQIWQEMGGTPETRGRAIQQANQEFGLAR